jgi:hypothetical protein
MGRSLLTKMWLLLPFFISMDTAAAPASAAGWSGECAADVDAHWLFDALKASPVKRDVKIGRATHLMHLEENRYALYHEAQTFLDEGHHQPAQR